MDKPGRSASRTILLAVGALVLVAILAASAIVGLRAVASLPSDAQVEASRTVDDAWGHKIVANRLDDYISLSYGAASLCVFVIAVVVFLYASRVPQIDAWRRKVYSFAEVRPGMKTYVAVTLGIAVALSCVMLVKANTANPRPDGDEISYLESAIAIHDQYGPVGFAGALYTGQYRGNERHPLYLWLIALFAEQSPGFFVMVRLVSAAFALASIAAVVFVTWRLFGAAVATLALFFYGLSMTFLEMSSLVGCEGLLVTLVTLAFYFTVRGFSTQWLLLPAGAFAGLAYMTRLTGLLLPAAFIIAALALWGWRAFGRKWLWLYLAAFIVTASPLLVRNVVAYHSPFSNHVFSLAWLDQRGDAHTMDYAEGRTGMRDYFRRHGALQVALSFTEGGEAFLSGAAQTVSPLRKTLYTPRGSLRRLPIKVWAGMVVLFAGLLALVFDVDNGRRTYTLALGAVLFLSLAWYAKISNEPRLVFPYVPIVFAYASVSVVRLVRFWPYRAAVLAIASLIALTAVSVRLDILAPLRVRMPGEGAVVLADWLYAHVEPSDVYLIGPDDSLRLGWYREKRGVARSVPNTPTIDLLVEASRSLHAKYAVISRDLYDMRLLQFSSSFNTTDGNLTPYSDIPGWNRVFDDPIPPVDYIVYEVERGTTKGKASGGADGQ